MIFSNTTSHFLDAVKKIENRPFSDGFECTKITAKIVLNNSKTKWKNLQHNTRIFVFFLKFVFLTIISTVVGQF